MRGRAKTPVPTSIGRTCPMRKARFLNRVGLITSATLCLSFERCNLIRTARLRSKSGAELDALGVGCRRISVNTSALTFRRKWSTEPGAMVFLAPASKRSPAVIWRASTDDRVDFVFSFAVFQHVPDEGAIFSYFAETARVLRPGGVFRLHMKGLRPWAVGRWQIEAGFRIIDGS